MEETLYGGIDAKASWEKDKGETISVDDTPDFPSQMELVAAALEKEIDDDDEYQACIKDEEVGSRNGGREDSALEIITRVKELIEAKAKNNTVVTREVPVLTSEQHLQSSNIENHRIKKKLPVHHPLRIYIKPDTSLEGTSGSLPKDWREEQKAKWEEFCEEKLKEGLVAIDNRNEALSYSRSYKKADYFWEWDMGFKQWILVRDKNWVDPHKVYIPKVPEKLKKNPKLRAEAGKTRSTVPGRVKRKDQEDPARLGDPKSRALRSSRRSESQQKYIHWRDKRESEGLSSSAWSSHG